MKQADVAGLSPAADAEFPVKVSRAGSAVLLPQYCLRVGEPAEGSAYTENSAGVLAEVLSLSLYYSQA